MSCLQKKTVVRLAPLLTIASLSFLASGCGDSGMPMTKVSGNVTIAGGPPPQPGQIIFTQVAGTGQKGLPNRPAMAIFRTDGKFAARTFEDGDGLLPGTYTVRIDCFSGPLGEGKSARELSLVPAGWAPEQLVVTGDERSMTVNYEVPAK
jgi:hypothetical protein